MSHDIMIDLETLWPTPDAVILSIGAVRFDLESAIVFNADGDTFYRSLMIDTQSQRKISESTIVWWMSQSKEAQAVFSEPKMSLFNALADLQEWVNHSSPNVWSNGADFDLPMLANAFDQEKLVLPWKPYSRRCYLTYKNLPGARGVKVPRKGEHHNALDDAFYQAEHVCAIHKALFTPVKSSSPVEVAA